MKRVFQNCHFVRICFRGMRALTGLASPMLFLALVFLVYISPTALSQFNPSVINGSLTPNDAIGVVPYSSTDGEREIVSLGNGNLTIAIPLLSLPQLAGRFLNLGLVYNSKNWNLRSHATIQPYNTTIYLGYENDCIGTSWCADNNVSLKNNMPTLSANIRYEGIYTDIILAGCGPGSGYGFNIIADDYADYLTRVGSATGSGFIEGSGIISSEATTVCIYGYHPQFCVRDWIFTDWSGSKHTFANIRDCPVTENFVLATGDGGTDNGDAWQYSSSNLNESTDGSFIRLDTRNTNDLIVTEKDGTQYHFGGYQVSNNYVNNYDVEFYYAATFSRMIDLNGNTVTFNSDTGILTDTVGRQVTVAPGSVTYKDSNGITQTAGVTSIVGSGGSTTFQFPLTTGNSGSTTPCWFPFPLTTSLLPTGDYQNGPHVQTMNVYGLTGGPGFVNAFSNVAGPLATTFTISYPGGRSYQLTTDVLGQLTKIQYPGGGYARFDYTSSPAQVQIGTLACKVTANQVAHKYVCDEANGSCAQEATTTYLGYPDTFGFGNTTMYVTDPLGNVTEHDFVEQYYPPSTPPIETFTFTYSGADTGYNPLYFPGNPPPLRSTATTWTNSLGSEGISSALPQSVTTTDYTVSSAQTVTTTYQYDTANLPAYFNNNFYGGIAVSGNNGYGVATQATIDNVLSVTQTDFSGNIIQTTTNQWQKGGVYDGYTGGHVLDRLASKTVTDNVTGFASTNSYGWDTVGNAISASASGTGTAAVTTQYPRNPNGDINEVIDPLTHATTYAYSGPWYDSACAPGATSAGRPTKITDALGDITTALYYSCTGLLAQETDPNGASTNYHYDALGRLTKKTNPDGGVTQNSFVDASTPNTVTTTVTATPNPTISTTTVLDGLSRVSQTQLTSDPGGTTFVDTTYDPMERVYTVSNPYRSKSDATYGYTISTYDALSRKIQLQHEPDGTSQSWQYTGMSIVAFTDESGLTWTKSYDSLGRFTGVSEPSNTSGASYGYSLNNLTSVTQTGGGVAGQTTLKRSFSYDGLSRLVTSTNPETGTICYGQWNGSTCVPGYDVDSNLKYKTDARRLTVAYTYDALNRLVSKIAMNDPSAAPASCYQYGLPGSTASGGYQIGRLIASWTQKVPSGTTTCPSAPPAGALTSRLISGYDSMGRVQVEKQCVLTVCSSDPASTTTYSYDQAGHLKSQSNYLGTGSSQYTYDGSGRLSSASGPVSSSTNSTFYPATLFSSPVYTAAGAIQSVQYGTGLTLNRTYDSRLRVTGEIDTGTIVAAPIPGHTFIVISGGVQEK